MTTEILPETRPAVLAVDDEPRILSSLSALLEQDFAVVTATNPERALEILQRDRQQDGKFVVIIADQRMPGLPGDEFLAKARDLSLAARILVTGYADINALIRAVNHGQIYTYVGKPWEPLQLKVTVAKAAEHCRLQKEVMHERELLRGLMDNIPDLIWFKNSAGVFSLVNKAAAEFLGLADPALATGKTKFDFFPHPEAQANRDEDEVVLRSGKALANQIRALHPNDGVTRWMSITKAPIKASDPDDVALVAVWRDITEQRQAEIALEESQARAKAFEEQFRQAQKLEAVGRLAGGVAHDFNNFLTVISGYCQILLRRLEAGNPLRGQVEKIETAADRASKLTQQLLSFSRRQVVNPEISNLNAVVDNFRKMCLPIIGEDIDLTTHLAPDLGLVRADVTQIEQVLMNLVVNARDAMPRGGSLTIETANVEVESAQAAGRGVKRMRNSADLAAPGESVVRDFLQSGGQTDLVSGPPADLAPGLYITLSVADSGCGMDTETQRRVFEPFFTTKPEGKGTGLGLSIVHGIVCQHGGTIQLKSEARRGTRFTIYLPRVIGEEQPAASSSPPSEWPHGKGIILVVEDRAALRELIRDTLEPCGYTVLEAGDGEAGWEIFARQSESIDLVITDLTMPRLSGSELSTRIKQLRPDTKLLYMSGYAADCLTPGPPENRGMLLQKPFTPQALLGKVQEILALARTQPAILVVDDDPEIRELLRSVLESNGYRVITAENGRQATELLSRLTKDCAPGLKETDVALMVTDLVMPEQEGIETIAKVRREHPNLRIVAMSGLFGRDMLDAARCLGADAIFRKPVDVSRFPELVAKVLKADKPVKAERLRN
jgi:PAS domain S-box-containing protein